MEGNSMDVVLALGRVAAEGAAASGPEAALWAITRAASSMLGDPAAALRPNAFRDKAPPPIGAAATAFLRMPDGRHHLIAAPTARRLGADENEATFRAKLASIARHKPQEASPEKQARKPNQKGG